MMPVSGSSVLARDEAMAESPARGPVMSQTGSDLAKELISIRSSLDKLSAGISRPNLQFTSITEGELKLYDGLGDLMGRLGKQVDGTFATKYIDGTPPAVHPSAPGLVGRELAITVFWDGVWLDGEEQPSPMSSNIVRIDVHMSEVNASFTPDGSTNVGSLNIEERNSVTIPCDDDVKYFKLVAVTNAGVASTPSTASSGQPLPASKIAAGVIIGDNIAANAIISNVSIQTGTTGKRIRMDGPNNEIRFYPVTGDTRYARLFSYTAAENAEDIAVELRAINSASAGTNVVSRLFVTPTSSFLGLTNNTDDLLFGGGCVQFLQTLAFIGIKSGAATSNSGFSFTDTQFIQAYGAFEIGGLTGPTAALFNDRASLPSSFGGIDFSFAGLTMASDVAVAYAVNWPVTQPFTGNHHWSERLTRTGVSIQRVTSGSNPANQTCIVTLWVWRVL